MCSSDLVEVPVYLDLDLFHRIVGKGADCVIINCQNGASADVLAWLRSPQAATRSIHVHVPDRIGDTVMWIQREHETVHEGRTPYRLFYGYGRYSPPLSWHRVYF